MVWLVWGARWLIVGVVDMSNILILQQELPSTKLTLENHITELPKASHNVLNKFMILC